MKYPFLSNTVWGYPTGLTHIEYVEMSTDMGPCFNFTDDVHKSALLNTAANVILGKLISTPHTWKMADARKRVNEYIEFSWCDGISLIDLIHETEGLMDDPGEFLNNRMMEMDRCTVNLNVVTTNLDDVINRYKSKT